MDRRTAILGFRWPAFLALVLTSALAGCNSSTPRSLPFPALNPRAAFPESPASMQAGQKEAPGQGEEEAIAKAMQTAGSASEGGTTSSGNQIVMVAGRFAAQIPLRYEEWRWSTDGDVTLIVHFSEARPDAMIYAEAFGSMVQKSPSEELLRFQVTVDPGLMSSVGFIGALLGLATNELQGLWGVMSRTAGLGLGYRSARNSFSGWKWVGRTEQGLAFRLARTSGTWGSADVSDAATAALKAVAGKLDAVKPLLAHFDVPVDVDQVAVPGASAEPNQDKKPTTPEVPAWMVLGTAVLQDDVGVHLAFLCARNPACRVTDDFVTFVETLQIPSRAVAREGEGFGVPSTMSELAEAAGVRIAPKEMLASLDDVVKIAAETAQKRRQGAAGQEVAPDATDVIEGDKDVP